MLVYIFRGLGSVFAVTESADGQNLPTRWAPWNSFKSLEMVKGAPQLGIDVDECLEDIAKHGFYLTDAHVRITEQAIS